MGHARTDLDMKADLSEHPIDGIKIQIVVNNSRRSSACSTRYEHRSGSVHPKKQKEKK
jgi:hypothetical protein